MSRRKPKLRLAVAGLLVLHASAIRKLAESDAGARWIWRSLTERGWCSLVPAAVLSEVMTGRAQDALVDRVIPALVAAHASRARQAIVMTGDVGDLEALLADCPHVRVLGV